MAAVVAYRMFAFVLMTTPLLIRGLWRFSCFAEKLGWTACAMSAEIRKLLRNARCGSSADEEDDPSNAEVIRLIVESIRVESAP